MDSFESVIKSSDKLSNIEKFSNLKHLFQGEALRTIEGVSFTSQNYFEALGLLKDTYGNP